MAVMSVRYLTMDGEIVSETRNGVKGDYIPDPLGNTYKLVNASGQVTDEYSYWPYGELRSHTGSSTTPYEFCGTKGYRQNSLGAYVRFNQLSQGQARWISLDRVWPLQISYAYAGCSPSVLTDPLGLFLCVVHGCDPISRECVLKSCFNCPLYDVECHQQCNFLASLYYIDCQNKGKKPFWPPLNMREPGNWTPISGVGVVPPPPLPPPPNGPSIGLPPAPCVTNGCPDSQLAFKCEQYATQSSGDVAGPPLYNSCESCCAGTYPVPLCQTALNSCLTGCKGAEGSWFLEWISQFKS